jgi:hypothetical protein
MKEIRNYQKFDLMKVIIPYEDMKGEWMIYSIDRVHFRREKKSSNRDYFRPYTELKKGVMDDYIQYSINVCLTKDKIIRGSLT